MRTPEIPSKPQCGENQQKGAFIGRLREILQQQSITGISYRTFLQQKWPLIGCTAWVNLSCTAQLFPPWIGPGTALKNSDCTDCTNSALYGPSWLSGTACVQPWFSCTVWPELGLLTLPKLNLDLASLAAHNRPSALFLLPKWVLCIPLLLPKRPLSLAQMSVMYPSSSSHLFISLIHFS